MNVPKEVSDWMRKLGAKGGKARAASLTPEQMSRIGRKGGKKSKRGKAAKKSGPTPERSSD